MITKRSKRMIKGKRFNKKGLIAMLLCLIMILSTPITVLAVENERDFITYHEVKMEDLKDTLSTENDQKDENQNINGDNNPSNNNSANDNSNECQLNIPDNEPLTSDGEEEKLPDIEEQLNLDDETNDNQNSNQSSNESSNESGRGKFPYMTDDERWSLWNATNSFIEPIQPRQGRGAWQYSVGQEFMGAFTITGFHTFPAAPGVGYPFETTFTYGDVTGILAELNVPDNVLWCIQPNLPEPPVGARITYIATVVSVDEVNGRADFRIFAPNTDPFQDIGTKFGYAFITWTPITGGLKIQKVDADSGSTIPQGDGSLAGAVFHVISLNDNQVYVNGELYERGQVVLSMTTNEEGIADTGNHVLPPGSYQIVEISAPSGYRIPADHIRTFDITEHGVIVEVEAIREPIIRGDVEVEKQDLESITAQGAATLVGVEFEIRNRSANSIHFDGRTIMPNQVVTRISTVFESDKAVARTIGNVLPYGTYSITEVRSSTGYLLTDGTPRLFTIREHNSVVTGTIEGTSMIFRNNVMRGGVSVQKRDNETGFNIPQGAATLEGARFNIISLNSNPVIVNNQRFTNGQIVTSITTNAQGVATTPNHFLPYGNYRVVEVTPPIGYLNTGILSRDFSITSHGQVVQLHGTNNSIRNDVIRGDVQIVKFGEQSGNIQRPLEGVQFHFTSQTTGEVFTIVTDNQGFAHTNQLGNPKGGLPFDTYEVTETSPYEEFNIIEPFEITIDTQSHTLFLIIKNEGIEAPVVIRKIDSTTGNIIPLPDAQFQVLDEDGNPITMIVTRYPHKITTDVFRTDESGQLMLPEQLPAGNYFIREIRAPYGYLLGEDIPFTVGKGFHWSNPLTIEFANDPAMGRIEIIKTDEFTKEPLEGVIFEVRAREDIVTGDGTLHALAGEVIQVITTDKNGIATTVELFLGAYEVEEIQTLEGYILTGEILSVDLIYTDQYTPIVITSVDITNVLNRLVIVKEERGTQTPLAGVEFELWHEEMGTFKEKLTTNENGKIILEGLRSGRWFLQETKPLVGYLPNETTFSFQVGTDGRIEGEAIFTITIENARTKIIRTVALEVTTGTDQILATGIVAVNDKVYFKNAQVGRTYVLKATAMDRTHYDETGEIVPLIIDGEPLTSELRFVAKVSSGYVYVPFTFDATGLGERSMTFFERMYIVDEDTGEIAVDEDGNDILVADHEDIYDEEQTIYFISPEEPKAPERDSAPQTGDKGDGIIWIVVCFLAISFLIVTIRRNKKANHDNTEDSDESKE